MIDLAYKKNLIDGLLLLWWVFLLTYFDHSLDLYYFLGFVIIFVFIGIPYLLILKYFFPEYTKKHEKRMKSRGDEWPDIFLMEWPVSMHYFFWYSWPAIFITTDSYMIHYYPFMKIDYAGEFHLIVVGFIINLFLSQLEIHTGVLTKIDNYLLEQNNSTAQ